MSDLMLIGMIQRRLLRLLQDKYKFKKNDGAAAAVIFFCQLLSWNEVQSVHSIIVGFASCVPTWMLEREQ